MARSLLEEAMTPEVLDISWRRLRCEHTPWSFDVSREQLQQHLLGHILRCREEVLSGSYRPQPLRQFPMQKPDGKQRILSAQYLRDKLVQRALLTILEPRAEKLFHNDSYAYRPGRSVAMALKKVCERVRIGQCWLVDADIKSFFDTIPHSQLKKILKNFLHDANAFELVEKWLAQGAHHQSLLGQRRGISQGAILSPLFCNLYLHQFDIAMSRVDIPFVRFADDFLLFSTDKSKAHDAMDFAAGQLHKLGLALHPEKSRIVRSGSAVKFLGEPLPESM
jgi:RNA-directed DNA polymerase